MNQNHKGERRRALWAFYVVHALLCASSASDCDATCKALKDHTSLGPTASRPATVHGLLAMHAAHDPPASTLRASRCPALSGARPSAGRSSTRSRP